jgi:hypothetical protein
MLQALESHDTEFWGCPRWRALRAKVLDWLDSSEKIIISHHQTQLILLFLPLLAENGKLGARR